MHRQALLEIFKPVEDDVDLGRNGNSSLRLVRVDNAVESTVWQDICLSRKLRRTSIAQPVRHQTIFGFSFAGSSRMSGSLFRIEARMSDTVSP
jgi:hypothetical protein